MEQKNIPVLLLTGYLGSGKTTLLNRILTNRRGIKFAVIVNDIGEVNIDASLIQKGGIVGDTGGDLVAMQNGCICCTLKMDLVKQLLELSGSGNFDYIVIEASGICEPEPIARTIAMIPQIAGDQHNKPLPVLDCIVTVVDALRMNSEFDNGSALARKNIGEEDIENLVIQQIEFCNIVLLNKISEVSMEDANVIRGIIRALQPDARIIDCDYADVDFDVLLNTGMFDYRSVSTSAAWIKKLESEVGPDEDEEDDGHEHHHHGHHHDDEEGDGHEHHHHHHHHDHEEGEAEEYGIGTFVYYRRRPFDLNKFDYFLDREWPASVIRAKGIIYLEQNPDMSYLFEQAGVQKAISESGYWFATAPKEEFEAMAAADPSILRDWDPEIGDRMIKIVFIGRDMDRNAIIAALDDCLA